MDLANITNINKSNFGTSIPTHFLVGNNNFIKNNIITPEEIEKLMGTTPYDMNMGPGDNILAAIVNGTFPTAEVITLTGLIFSPSGEVWIPQNVILENCEVEKGRVCFYHGSLISTAKDAIADAWGPDAKAIARAAHAKAGASVSGAEAIAKCADATAFAAVAGSKAFATASGAEAIASGAGGRAYANAKGAYAIAEVGGAKSYATVGWAIASAEEAGAKAKARAAGAQAIARKARAQAIASAGKAIAYAAAAEAKAVARAAGAIALAKVPGSDSEATAEGARAIADADDTIATARVPNSIAVAARAGARAYAEVSNAKAIAAENGAHAHATAAEAVALAKAFGAIASSWVDSARAVAEVEGAIAEANINGAYASAQARSSYAVANADKAEAFAATPNAVAYATTDGSTAYAIAAEAKAYADAAGATAVASAAGAISYATKNNARAYAIVTGAISRATVSGARALNSEQFSDRFQQLKLMAGYNIYAPIEEDSIEAKSIFHTKFSSAFKVTDSEIAHWMISVQITKGWRWVTPGFINDKEESPVKNAKQMPKLSIGDWIILEGKTIRLIKANSDDKSEQMLRAKLENKFVNTNEDFTLAEKSFIGEENDELSGSADMLSNLNISKPTDRKAIEAFYPGELPPDSFEESYARLAGAYIRHLERLPKLSEAFDRFFDGKEIVQSIQTNLFGKPPVKYDKYLAVNLKNNSLTPTDLLLIKQALGITIDAKTITDQSTIQNTVPLKKVLEILTCINPLEVKDRPWLVSLNIFGRDRSFLLSAGQLLGDGNQLMVSMYDKREKDTWCFVGSAYPFWMEGKRITAEEVYNALNNPISQSPALNTDCKNLIEFIVCTQVVESHCTLGFLEKSRLPGSGKHARAIFQHHLAEGNSPLSSSFNVRTSKSNRVFPMAGTDGTGNTRNAVNSLKKLKGKAPVTDMSEDSEVFEEET